jgi:hypothetical protein
MYQAAGLLKGSPRCYVLDSTDPAKLKAILADMKVRGRCSIADALRSTLVVGMAMGMTSYEPVVNLQKLARLFEKHGVDGRANFVYMTLPGSLLDQFAGPRGFRRVELQLDGGNSTAGRHSGPLTRGSLYPLGLAGVDLGKWIADAQLRDDEVARAWALAAFLETQAKQGRDKVTLLTAKPLGAAELWTKQDFEESLGKSEETGLKIVIGERARLAHYRAAKDARQDRVFLAVEQAGQARVDRNKLMLLRRKGYPVALLTVPARASLSRYMQFIHYAVFGLAWLRKMNFVTQPGVELYKAITKPLHDEAILNGGVEKTQEWRESAESPRQTKFPGGITLHWDRLNCRIDLADRSAAEAYASLLTQFTDARAVEYGELTFFGDMRYSAQGKAMRRVLERAGDRVFRGALQIPVDIYEGPAMNHSYHEMVIGHGRCFSTVLLSEQGESIPEAAYTPDYHRAQFLATQMALERRARLVVSITLRDLGERSLQALDRFFSEVARILKG